MALESVTYIADLTVTNPTTTDPKSQGDDHLRNIKTAAKNSIAGFTGMVLVTGTEAQGSTINDYTVTLSTAPAAYTASVLVLFKATHTNTSTCTLQINALGTKTLKDTNGNALQAGSITSGSSYLAFYDGTDFFLLNGLFYGLTQSLGDSSTKYATTAFVANTSFSTNLPAQTSNEGRFLQTDGTNASWQTLPDFIFQNLGVV